VSVSVTMLAACWDVRSYTCKYIDSTVSLHVQCHVDPLFLCCIFFFFVDLELPSLALESSSVFIQKSPRKRQMQRRLAIT
jgi:hypothetical protein